MRFLSTFLSSFIEKTDWFINENDLLPNSKFPIIFQHVKGTCQKPQSSTSCFNMDEVLMVIHFITKLLSRPWNGREISQSDIGVVCPYSLQCKKIQFECKRCQYDDITIGTAEIFQGQERPIMIVSTVRTDRKLGFVEDPRVSMLNITHFSTSIVLVLNTFSLQRMNVMITRAISLLIIISDKDAIVSSETWRKLYEYCINNQAYLK